MLHVKKIFFTLLTVILSLTLISCEDTESYDIVATMYTHYQISEEIVNDYMRVKMLTPIGEGIHDFEASSQDMIAIENAKLFLYTSTSIDTWITDPDTIGGDDTMVINLSTSIHAHEHDEQSYHKRQSLSTEDHDHSEDVHYWVDPMNAIEIAETILDAVIDIDPLHEDEYRRNADAFIQEIETRSADFEDYLDHLIETPTIFVAGHNAFSLFGEHFDLPMTSIFDEFEPDAVLTSSELIPFVEAVREAGTHYLYVDALEVQTSAIAIRDYLSSQYDYDLTILKLYAYQNVSQEDFDAGVSYIDLLQRNINNLKQSLGA